MWIWFYKLHISSNLFGRSCKNKDRKQESENREKRTEGRLRCAHSAKFDYGGDLRYENKRMSEERQADKRAYDFQAGNRFGYKAAERENSGFGK